MDAQILADVLNESSFLRRLNISRTKLGLDMTEGVEAIFNAVAISKLRTLDVAENHLVGLDHKYFAKLANASLVRLNVCGNKLNTAVIQELAKGMASFKTLYLGNCDVSSDGLAAIANALQKTQCSVRDLMLSRIVLGQHDVKALAGALQQNTSLQVLWLDSTTIAQDEYHALLAAAHGTQIIR